MGETVQVHLDSVTKTYDRVIGVDALNLQVNKGEFFSLLGPSGCGKSTTLRLVAGFEQPDRGTVTIAGQPMQGVPPYKRNIGIVFQSYALFPHLDVFENVAFGLRTRRIAKSEIRTRVAQAIETVELTGLEKRKPHQLSGGQQQRVALARAIVIQPDVLLLDEPLGALDKKLRENMQVRLIELHRELGITTIYVTHDQEEALTMSDRIAVMSSEAHGLVQLDTPERLYKNPGSLFVANFIGTSSVLFDTVTEIADGYATTDGGFRAQYSPGFQAQRGASVALSVRPEKIAISANLEAEPASPNFLKGVVETIVFLGESTTYLVRANDREFRVKRFHDADHRVIAEGTPVLLSWHPDDTSIFIQ
jgi:spermidine/putrescine transport system ATP-binding protein